MDDAEVKPLLSVEVNATYGGTEGAEIDDWIDKSVQGRPQQATASSIGPDEVPPPYQPRGGVPMVTCRVCGEMIDITIKRDQHVVKCNICNEATPIRNAPPGKKYVRCPCKCLLICKSTSQRIACPRTDCKRIINLAPSPVTPPAPTMAGMSRVTCGHCSDTFLFNRFNNSFVRCPHCRMISSVGPDCARRRAILFMVVGLVALIVGIALTAGTINYAQDHAGIYIAYIGIFLVASYFFYRTTFFCRLKISSFDDPM